MVEERFDDLIMRTDLYVENGKICCPKVESKISLEDLEPKKAEQGAFAFYSAASPDTLICSIKYVIKRSKPELCYSTKKQYLKQGYMKKAMEHTLGWITRNKVKGCLWLLIDQKNIASVKIAQRFNFIKQNDKLNGQDWYCLKLDDIEQKELSHV